MYIILSEINISWIMYVCIYINTHITDVCIKKCNKLEDCTYTELNAIQVTLYQGI